MKAVIREATEADADIISSLNIDVQAAHASAMPWWFKPASPDTFPSEVVARLLDIRAIFCSSPRLSHLQRAMSMRKSWIGRRHRLIMHTKWSTFTTSVCARRTDDKGSAGLYLKRYRRQQTKGIFV